MSLSHLGVGLSSANLPINSIYCPGVSTGFVLSTANVVSQATSATPSAAQFVNGIVVITGSTGSLTVTPPAATDLYNYVVSQGIYPSLSSPFDAFNFMIVNQNSNSITLNTASGVTLVVGANTLATNTSKSYRAVFTSASSVVIYG